jgi:hypothetical protein
MVMPKTKFVSRSDPVWAFRPAQIYPPSFEEVGFDASSSCLLGNGLELFDNDEQTVDEVSVRQFTILDSDINNDLDYGQTTVQLYFLQYGQLQNYNWSCEIVPIEVRKGVCRRLRLDFYANIENQDPSLEYQVLIYAETTYGMTHYSYVSRDLYPEDSYFAYALLEANNVPIWYSLFFPMFYFKTYGYILPTDAGEGNYYPIIPAEEFGPSFVRPGFATEFGIDRYVPDAFFVPSPNHIEGWHDSGTPMFLLFVVLGLFALAIYALMTRK